MVIETKFGIGDKIYPIFLSSQWVSNNICPVCKEKGIVKIENTDLYATCPKCHGSGGIFDVVNEWSIAVNEETIEAIHIYKKDRKYYVEYVDYVENEYPEEDVFSSKEEALKECEKRNNLENGNKD